MKSTPFFLHINGMVAWRDLHLTSMHGTLWAGGRRHVSRHSAEQYTIIWKRTTEEIVPAYLKGLVDVLGPGLVSLFHWQLCLFELQELAPEKLKGKTKHACIFKIYFYAWKPKKKQMKAWLYSSVELRELNNWTAHNVIQPLTTLNCLNDFFWQCGAADNFTSGWIKRNTLVTPCHCSVSSDREWHSHDSSED